MSSEHPAAPAARKALALHERLCAAYECPVPYFHELDPLSELISSLLSHRTRNADSGRAFRQLRAAFPSWEAVRDAATGAVEETIAPCTWSEQKAPRIQAVLRRIGELRGGDPGLDFLGELPVPEVRVGLIPPGVSAGPAHARLAALLPRDWCAQQLYDHHEVFMLHGQRCCVHRSPACGRCPVLDLCPTGQLRLGAG